MKAIWNIYLRDNGERVMRPVPGDHHPSQGEWFVGRTPAFMTREQAEEWHDALLSLGEGKDMAWPVNADATPKSSAWRPCSERPTPADSPIMLRGQTTEVLRRLQRLAVRCECDLLPAECMCARMREQVPAKCPLTWRVRHAWISWREASMRETRCAMWLAGGMRSHGHYDRSRYADCIANKRAAGLDLGRAIAYEIAREHPMDRAHREIDDGLHTVMAKLEAM